MTKDEALDLALEALEGNTTNPIIDPDQAAIEDQAINAIKQARALDKKAENARELGLDYEPVQKQRWAVFCSFCNKEWSVSYQHPGKSVCLDCDDAPPAAATVQEPVAWAHKEGLEKINDFDASIYARGGFDDAVSLYTTPPAAPDLQAELDATNRQVEILSDALAESRREVAAMKAVQEPVAWVCYGAPGKRDIDFEEADINKLPIGTQLYTTPPAAKREWTGLTKEEIKSLKKLAIDPVDANGWGFFNRERFAELIEASLKELNT